MEIRKNPKASLENKRYLFLEIGFIVALLFVLAAFEYKSYEPNTFNKDFSFFERDDFVLPPITRQKPEMPKPPLQPIRSIIIDISADNIDDYLIGVHIDEDEPSFDLTLTQDDDEESVQDDHPVRFIENRAKYPGGMKALYQFLKDNLVYPEEAINAGVQGRVYLDFVIEKDGTVSNIVLLRGIGFGCDEEACRVIKLMPPWKPAQQNGRRVRYALTLPVKFTLK